MRILIVDDESAAIANFSAFVADNEHNWECVLKRNPQQALEYAKREQPEAAFLDINMPDMDGVDLAEELVKINPAMYIVFISGYAQDENAIAERLGKNLKGFCYKPYDADKLYNFLHRVAARGNIKAEVTTFGTFEIALRGRPLQFSRAKSKELLAFLIDNDGKTVSMDASMDALWFGKTGDKAAKLYQDAKMRLRLTLSGYDLDDLVYFYRGALAINRDRITCDLWQAQETGDYSAYHGEYMTQYGDWSVAKQAVLDSLIDK